MVHSVNWLRRICAMALSSSKRLLLSGYFCKLRSQGFRAVRSKRRLQLLRFGLLLAEGRGVRLLSAHAPGHSDQKCDDSDDQLHSHGTGPDSQAHMKTLPQFAGNYVALGLGAPAAPIIFDATHSVAAAGRQGTSSRAERQFVPALAR